MSMSWTTPNHQLINMYKEQCSGAATSRAEPEPIFCWSEPRTAAPAASFRLAKKESPLLVSNIRRAVYVKVNMIKKRLTLIINFSQSSKWQILVCGAGAAFLGWSLSRRNLVEAGVGSGTSDFRSRSRPKKYRLRNTDKEKQLHIFHEMFKCFRYPSGITNTIKFFFLYCTVPVWYEIDCKLTKQAVNCQSETN